MRLQRAGAEWQLVHGTEILDQFGRPRAPDLSLQTGNAPPDPTLKHVVAIWDAKLRGRTGQARDRPITDGEFRSFVVLLRWLEVPAPGDPAEALLGDFPPAFQVRGLITNGRGPTEPDAVFLDERVAVVEHFQHAGTPCSPARRAHLIAAAAHKTPGATGTAGVTRPVESA
jgi:hypothetical protein